MLQLASAAAAAATTLPVLPSWLGLALCGIIVVVLALVAAEEPLRMRKSLPALLGGGLAWLIVGVVLASVGRSDLASHVFAETLTEYGELMLFLVVAMSYVNTLQDRLLFEGLRTKLIGQGWSLRQLYWITGVLAFLISPVADNLTTALLLGAVALAVGEGQPAFCRAACVNIVVAANAGGAFSPFGDITTLMVWQRGIVPFAGFFALFLPSLVNWLVPAALISLAVPSGRPTAEAGAVALKPGAIPVLVLFILTIAGTVVLHQLTHLPPVFGMMTGLGLLKGYSWLLERRGQTGDTVNEPEDVFTDTESAAPAAPGAFDVHRQLERTEWDTLLFFYGMMLCVSALGAVGLLQAASLATYGHLGPTTANVLAGLGSAVIDNIPILFAILQMHPDMSISQWLLVTLTTGTGGSLLSIGSAAGVALMGQARGVYTFGSHLRWSWAVALGFVASIAVHLWLTAAMA
jgi:Na+/H+ antiporter NhaD/arsenite permease-like protein